MISNHMASWICDEIIYQILPVKGATVEIWERMNNSMPHYLMKSITYAYWD